MEPEEKKSPLSTDFKIACEIYHYNLQGEKIWYNKLVSTLEGKFSKNTITRAMNVLFDWGIVKAEYGETENGKPGKLLKISYDAESIVRRLYENYWRDHR